MALPRRSCKAEVARAVRPPVNFLPARIGRGGSKTAATSQEIAPIVPRLAPIASRAARTGQATARRTGPNGSRTARSIATIASSGAAKILDQVRQSSGPRLLVGSSLLGRLRRSPVPSVGPRGARSPAGSATAGRDSTAYSYGDNVYYEGDSVYYGDQAVATAEEYTQQAEEIAASAPEIAPDKAEWMPLGVFALTPDGQASGPDPTLFLQLAISKEGIINGTLNNTATNQTQTIEGMADKASQRAAWTVAGKTRPIMETGIVNLTENTAPALVHFADGQTQQWLMVRLEDPAAKQ